MPASNLMQDIQLFLPEILVVGALVVLFISDAAWPASRKNFMSLWVTLFTCGLGLLSTYILSNSPATTFFSGLVASDSFTHFFRYLFFFAAGLSVYLSFGSHELEEKNRLEFCVLLLCVLFGMSLMAASTHLLTLYIGIETVSIISFVMAGFKREDLKSNEASLKYFIFGALASGVMVYGFSLLYGLAGSLQYSGIATYLAESGAQSPLVLGFAFFLIYGGLAYKVSAFPMHFWTPDVYEGAPTPVVTFFSVAPKAAGFAALLRFLLGPLATETTPGMWVSIQGLPWVPWIAVLAAITMTVGNLSALGQTNVKRMLAYSSIAHVGYMLMGVVALDKTGLSAILFYLVAYCFMNIGAFWVVSVVSNFRGNENLDAFRGMGWVNPLLGTVMAVFLFSLTGIPLFAGFIGKFWLFGAIVKTQGYMWLAVLGVLNSVISLYYYAKVLKMMWLEKPEEEETVALSLYHSVPLLGLAIPTVIFGLFFTPLIRFVEMSLATIL